MRDEPRAVHAVAVEPTAQLVVDAPVGHLVQRQRDHVEDVFFTPLVVVSKEEAEGRAQQEIRLAASQQGLRLWRNNVGATPAAVEYHCPRCHFEGEAKQRVVRYGLANDSQQLNAVVKSSDLIGVMPRLITPELVGTTIGQFIAVECKRPGWRYTGKGREEAQQAYLAVVSGKGGLARFSTGGVDL